MNQQDINNLEQRIEELEKKLAEHQHLGMDGSKEFVLIKYLVRN